ncbi:hypothetical protein DOY81_010572, partial [Sarcophaga bullata]
IVVKPTSSVSIKLQKQSNLQEVGSWFSVGEQFPVALVVDTLYQGELDLRVVELFDVSTTGLASGNSFNLDDLDRVGTSTMTGTHITVTLCDSTTNSQVTVFTVHVVGTGTGIVTQPNTEVLDFDG